jgi:glycosyltransferase involved in cell wall biosynthesis
MRFSVDAHAIGQHLTGNETYIRNLLNNFARLDKDAEFVTYLSRASAFSDVPHRFAKRLVPENPYLRVGLDLSRKTRQDAPELLHVQYTSPLFCPVPIVATVHDLSFLEHPEYFTRFRALQLRLSVKRTVARAARIITVSEFSKESILRAYGLPDEKVVVIPNGVSSEFRPIDREMARRALQPELRVPFILCVSDVQPRKNHLRLVAAFESLLKAHPKLPHHLVFVGKETWFSPVVKAAAAKSGVANRIHFTGFVSDDQLLRYYNACDLFAYPSLYEGFGLPILEAMACARAVVCSNTSSMPEVADSAALLFDPTSVEQITRAMADLLLDVNLRGRMERLGLQNAAKFSWETSAARTLDVYYAVAGIKRPSRGATVAPSTFALRNRV